MPQSDPGAYASRLAPAAFDFLVRWIYWPSRIDDVRERIVELLELDEKTSVLEPGAGTGGLTRLMIGRFLLRRCRSIQLVGRLTIQLRCFALRFFIQFRRVCG